MLALRFQPLDHKELSTRTAISKSNLYKYLKRLFRGHYIIESVDIIGEGKDGEIMTKKRYHAKHFN